MGIDRTPALGPGQRALIVVEVRGPLSKPQAEAFDAALRQFLQEHAPDKNRVGVVVQSQ